jgi:hypothetical protein
MHCRNGYVSDIIPLTDRQTEDGIASKKRQLSQNMKYNTKLNVWGNPSNCIPLVFEHFGCWGKKQANFCMNYP